MKKFIVTLLILGFIAVGGNYFYTKVFNKTEKIDPSKDFYVEVTNEYINIREESKQLSNNLGRVKKGEKYLVYDVNSSDGSYIWYKIKYDKDNLFKKDAIVSEMEKLTKKTTLKIGTSKELKNLIVTKQKQKKQLKLHKCLMMKF